ncbi:hypothetical protein [Bradyrhizobium sp. CCGB20]|nr:hypothetical protein [Bradyrhizobium sp. CCGB20]MCP3399419.1 hypothetical protein [Bradyrhizobium sp. CCGB20]
MVQANAADALTRAEKEKQCLEASVQFDEVADWIVARVSQIQRSTIMMRC